MPKVVDHAQRRREIVWALWSVISERGIDGVTFQAVAGAGGVSVGRIQHYFDSKDQLVRAGAEHMVGEAETRYGEGDPTDPRTRLTTLLTQPIPSAGTGRVGVSVWYAYLAKSASDPWIRSFMEDASRGTHEETERLLSELGVPSDDIRESARRLVALSNGVTQSVLVGATEPADGVATVMNEVERTIVADHLT